ncbi:DHA2 family efflux MFS transporter permease subunit [Enterococcus hirae]|nr:DHA2 family efflux MFS transporter permease subunit [Enterococcus hirae]
MFENEKISKKVICGILATGLLSFCGIVVETAMNITFPTLMAEFGIGTSTVQWLTTLYLLVVAMIVPLSAILKRRFRTKSLFIVSNLLFLSGIILDTFAPTFALLLLGRGIQGLGTGIALPLMYNIILEQVPRKKIGTMMGVANLITAIAPALGPTFGGFVLSFLDWRYIFIFLIPILIASFFIGIWAIEQKSAIESVKVDHLGIILIILTFSSLIFGVSNIGNVGLLSLAGGGVLLFGIIMAALFSVHSLRNDHPVIDLKTLSNMHFTSFVLAFFLFQLAILSVSFLLPNYIQLVNHSEAVIAGLVILPGALIGALFAPASGRFLDTFGPKIPLVAGSILCIVSFACYSLFSLGMNNILIGWIYLFFMIGISMSMGNLMTSGLSHLGITKRADGNAIFTTVQQFAGAVGVSLASTLVSLSQANETLSLTQSTAIGSQHAFILLAALCVIQLLLVFKALKPDPKQS